MSLNDGMKQIDHLPPFWSVKVSGECINLEVKLCRPFESLSLIYNFQWIEEGVSEGVSVDPGSARYLHQ